MDIIWDKKLTKNRNEKGNANEEMAKNILGCWVNGKRHGKGIKYFSNDDKYEGKFLNDD